LVSSHEASRLADVATAQVADLEGGDVAAAIQAATIDAPEVGVTPPLAATDLLLGRSPPLSAAAAGRRVAVAADNGGVFSANWHSHCSWLFRCSSTPDFRP
jgi:hypothetical protein